MNDVKQAIAVAFISLNLLAGLLFLPAANCLAKNDGLGMLEQSKGLLSPDKIDDRRWVEEKTGQYLPLDLTFIDETGESLQLGDFIDRPTLLLPIYFYCPNICSRNLANLAVALGNLSAKAGEDYRVIALSFNDVETPEIAAMAKRNYLKIVGDTFPEAEWKFLTGDKESIRKATDAVGFKFTKSDDVTFIHPAALIAIGEDGKVIRYVYGSFLAGDIDMALIDAAKGTPSLSVKRLLSFCFNYDPDQNKSVFSYVKFGVTLFFTLAVIFVFIYFKRRKVAAVEQ